MIAATVTVVSVSLTVTASAVVYTDARCPKCGKMLAAVPGSDRIGTYVRDSATDRSGRGVVVSCGRCKSLVEVIRHG